MAEEIEKVEIIIVKREPGPLYQGYMLDGLDDEKARRLFEHKFGYLPREVLWDAAIVKAGPILAAQEQEAEANVA